MNTEDNLADALRDVLSWALAKCPCENELPDPCPLCDATVASGSCKAIEATVPAWILAKMNAALSEHAAQPEQGEFDEGDFELAAELATRLIASGPKASHVSASECHELSEFVHAAIAALRQRVPNAADLGAIRAGVDGLLAIFKTIALDGDGDNHVSMSLDAAVACDRLLALIDSQQESRK